MPQIAYTRPVKSTTWQVNQTSAHVRRHKLFPDTRFTSIEELGLKEAQDDDRIAELTKRRPCVSSIEASLHCSKSNRSCWLSLTMLERGGSAPVSGVVMAAAMQLLS